MQAGISISTLAIDRRFKFIVVQILHPRLGVFLGVAVIVYLHQLTEVSFCDFEQKALNASPTQEPALTRPNSSKRYYRIR
jgi:hypothetical protein